MTLEFVSFTPYFHLMVYSYGLLDLNSACPCGPVVGGVGEWGQRTPWYFPLCNILGWKRKSLTSCHMVTSARTLYIYFVPSALPPPHQGTNLQPPVTNFSTSAIDLRCVTHPVTVEPFLDFQSALHLPFYVITTSKGKVNSAESCISNS